MAEALNADEDIQDVVALSGLATPKWFKHLQIPNGWEALPLADTLGQPVARIAVTGPIGHGEWEAADTLSAFGYTGWLVFDDVLRNAAGTLRRLGATAVVVRMLPVPPMQWTAAVRSHGIASISGRDMWIQQSNYVAGSERTGAGRLIVHSLLVDSVIREGLGEQINRLGNDVYRGFVASLGGKKRG